MGRAQDTKAGGRGTLATQPASTARASASAAASTKRKITSRMQPIAITPWPALATTTCARHRPERRGDALAVARRRRRIEAAAQHAAPATALVGSE